MGRAAGALRQHDGNDAGDRGRRVRHRESGLPRDHRPPGPLDARVPGVRAGQDLTKGRSESTRCTWSRAATGTSAGPRPVWRGRLARWTSKDDTDPVEEAKTGVA